MGILHIKNVHKKFRYNCEKCDKSFYQKNYLNRHIKSVHEIVKTQIEDQPKISQKSSSASGTLETSIDVDPDIEIEIKEEILED